MDFLLDYISDIFFVYLEKVTIPQKIKYQMYHNNQNIEKINNNRFI